MADHEKTHAPSGGSGTEAAAAAAAEARMNVRSAAQYADIGGPFYVDNCREWMAAKERLIVAKGEVEAPTYKNGLLLPPRRSKEAAASHELTFEGGICAADGSYVAGHLRNAFEPQSHLSCFGPYVVDNDEVVYRDEDVIFGGFIFSRFSHQLVESTSRLWYVTDRKNDDRKIVFFSLNSGSLARSGFTQFLTLLGIDPSRAEVVARPTRFAKITVPDQAFVSQSGADTKFLDVFRAMSRRAQGPTYEKVYLAASGSGRHDCTNEDFLEDFHRSRGFEVVHPEELSFEEQISVAANAKELATSLGTMSHLFLFAAPGAKLTVYLRSNTVVPAQLLIDKVAGQEPAYVYVARNLLPTSRGTAVCLLGPTRYFRKHLLDEGVEFTEEELAGFDPAGQDIVDYLCRYDSVFLSERNQHEAAAWDMSDVLSTLHEGLNDVSVIEGAYDEASALKVREAQGQDERPGQGVSVAAGAAAEDESLDPAPSFELFWCGYRGDKLSLQVKSAAVDEGFVGSIVAAQKATGERRSIDQSAFVASDGMIFVTLDPMSFFMGFEDAQECSRWELFVAAPGVFKPIICPTGTWLGVEFCDYFICVDGRLLVPHLGSEGELCLWYLGEPKDAAVQELFEPRSGRPLVNELLLQILREERWDTLPVLYHDFKKRSIPCTAGEGCSVVYLDQSYKVGAYAYAQAKAGSSRGRHAAEDSSFFHRLGRRLAATKLGRFFGGLVSKDEPVRDDGAKDEKESQDISGEEAVGGEAGEADEGGESEGLGTGASGAVAKAAASHAPEAQAEAGSSAQRPSSNGAAPKK